MRAIKLTFAGFNLLTALLVIVAGLMPSTTPSVQAVAPVRVYTEDITLQSYDWRTALQPTAPGDPIYPYPRLNFDRLGPRRPVTTTVVVLESPGTRLTIAPEYGGRILRWFDKRNQRDVLYVNPVIKPTGWGYRGWWFATGGIEWAFPTNEHGLNEWRPWRYQTYRSGQYAAVTVSDHEDRTGLDISVTIALDTSDQISVIPRIVNRTRAPQTFQFWINAMLPYSPSVRFDFPAKKVEVHSTSDDRLPGPGQLMDWPIFNGRDFSIAASWKHYLGVFAAPATRGRASIYDPATGLGVTRTFPADVARGVKLFLLGDLPSGLYTDGNSRYFELWGGYTRTFDENAVLKPGASVQWVEYWWARHSP